MKEVPAKQFQCRPRKQDRPCPDKRKCIQKTNQDPDQQGIGILQNPQTCHALCHHCRHDQKLCPKPQTRHLPQTFSNPHQMTKRAVFLQFLTDFIIIFDDQQDSHKDHKEHTEPFCGNDRIPHGISKNLRDIDCLYFFRHFFNVLINNLPDCFAFYPEFLIEQHTASFDHRFHLCLVLINMQKNAANLCKQPHTEEPHAYACYSKDQAHHAEQKTPFSYFPKTRIFLQTDGSRI